MKRIILVAIFTISYSSADTRFSEETWHNINQIEMRITNSGQFGPLIYPKGANVEYLYGGGLWFGTIDTYYGTEKDSLVTICYGPHGGESECVPGLEGMSPGDPAAVIFMYPFNWPPPVDYFPMAPQRTRSDQDSWCCYNDFDPDYHIPGDTRPIGIEIYQSGYAWTYGGWQDAIFLIFEISNISGEELTDCYMGLCFDIAMSNGLNSMGFFNIILDKWYVLDADSFYIDNLAYTWVEEEEPGWVTFPPFVMGLDIMQSPYDLVPGQDKDGDGIPDEYEKDSAYYVNNVPAELWDADGDAVPDWRDPSEIPQLGMTACKLFTLNLDPNLDNERFLTLAGYNYKTGVYEPYDTLPMQPDDFRAIISSGPFAVEPDSIVTFVVSIFLADWYEIYETPDTALAELDHTLQSFFDHNWLLPGPPLAPNLTCIPGDKQITLVWDNYSETQPDPYYDIVCQPGPFYDPYYLQYDFEGYGIWKSLTGETGDWELLSRCDRANGIVFEDTMLNITAVDNGIFHSFVDEDVRNGFTYFYAVSAFDYNFVKDVEAALGYRPLYFESGYAGVPVMPRREPADYIPAGDVVVTSESGNEALVSFVTGRVMSPFEVGSPIYLEYGGPDTVSWDAIATIVDSFGPLIDTFDFGYPVDGVMHVGYIKNSDREVVDSAWLQAVIGNDYAGHEFMVLSGYALHGQFGMPEFPTFVELFDTIEVTGVYPPEYVVPMQSRVPLASIVHYEVFYDPVYMDTVVVPHPDTAYDHGFWAYRGNDYEVRWINTHGASSGRANSVEVEDVVTGEVLTFQPFQNTGATRHAGEGWCFTRHTTWVPWTEPSTDTIRLEGTSATRTRSLYINGGLIGLRNGGPLLDTIPYVGDVWYVRAAREYEPASVYGELEVRADAAMWATENVTLNVKVVPNPYLIHNEWQQSFSQRRLRFINLPSECTIRIFNINGELVKTMRHVETVVDDDGLSVVNNAGGDEWWDLLSMNREQVASGIYIFHVRSEVGDQVGKFVIIQ